VPLTDDSQRNICTVYNGDSSDRPVMIQTWTHFYKCRIPIANVFSLPLLDALIRCKSKLPVGLDAPDADAQPDACYRGL